MEGETPQNEKKRYFDKHFKNQLAKSLKNNKGEPDNIDRIQFGKTLKNYKQEQIIEYTNTLAADIQKNIECRETEQETKGVFNLTKILSDITAEKPHELPLAMKVHAESDSVFTIENVNFGDLHKFLYSAVNGSVDFVDMNKETKAVLYDTYKMLMEHVEKDASPDFLADIKSKISSGHLVSHPAVPTLTQIFQDKTLNPLNLPFDYLLNGELPNENKLNNCE